MKNIHIVHVMLIAAAIRCGSTIEERNTANLTRWTYIGAWLQGQITLPDGGLKILLEA